MKKLICVTLLSLSLTAGAQTKEATPRFDFRGINVAQVVQLIYSEALKDAYVIDPDVLTDQRTVSFRYDSRNGDVRVFIAAFFDSIGLAVTRRGSVDFIGKKPAIKPLDEEAEVYVYRPRFRDGSYLSDLLAPLFKGSFTAKKKIHAAPADMQSQNVVPVGSAADSVDRKSDTLVFSGSAAEIEKLKKIMPQVDLALGDVLVRGVLYEVQATKTDGSAFSLAVNLLGGKFSSGIGGAVVNPINTFIRFKNQTLDAVLSSLSGDSRFKVVSRPSLRVTSGTSGRFTVGQDVPVLGAVTYAGNGSAPVQSVEYRSSGMIFDLQPVIHGDQVELNVMQQVSNFVTTDTGVNASPTLIKRELKTALTLDDTEIVVLGGLTEDKETDTRNGPSFLPSFFHTKTADKSNTEILLILQLTKI